MSDIGIAAYTSPPHIFDHASPDSRMASHSSGYGDVSSRDKPGPSINPTILKTLTEKRITRDGNPPKRRGPKPDSKPALTRRQELNRQAQRTHRERKELYIKALEDEVLRLKEIFSNVTTDKDRLAEENRRLKNLIGQAGQSQPHQQGFAQSVLTPTSPEDTSNPSVGYASSMSGRSSSRVGPGSSTSTTFTPSSQFGGGPGSTTSMTPVQQHAILPAGQQMRSFAQPITPGPGGLDYDQAGIDFVLTLERPCMDHLPWLLERNAEGGGDEFCGHALMASCPPEPFPELTADIPFGYTNVNEQVVHTHGHGGKSGKSGKSGKAPKPVATTTQRTWELKKGDLATLLDLSTRLNLDGEITPVMAWGMVLAHPRLREMRQEDFQKLTDELKDKVRCYGFGAVMEDFEVRDALNNVFSTKPDPKYDASDF